jgi:hypothetical protein
MTPKEKAQELVSAYKKELLKGKYNISGFVIDELSEEIVLIAVNEIIKASPTNPTMNGIEDAQGHFTLADAAEALIFWEQVKTEIEKL